jgi:hypothetical protein
MNEVSAVALEHICDGPLLSHCREATGRWKTTRWFGFVLLPISLAVYRDPSYSATGVGLYRFHGRGAYSMSGSFREPLNKSCW